jgi:hypothetical protein
LYLPSWLVLVQTKIASIDRCPFFINQKELSMTQYELNPAIADATGQDVTGAASSTGAQKWMRKRAR